MPGISVRKSTQSIIGPVVVFASNAAKLGISAISRPEITKMP